ncbi:CGNR zinc finger domain-containing protein [Cellulomonas dongxiuzhuiae]|uniref:CGNR zinc finger domain-containing protein n=1 Tax=Cellulomonas dongxiuzhuiae TaxID=2819979 RepID=A0ABX8GLD4_9CELL|nr:CGNR zinc finger domain-containing protein [Cellulomonas dongxiuzhuiae]MBO3095507.1 CGNR zinc finger domain-containing protein [Cellulomonas dongxiuzhuiae]QWC16486.1 CGNR zinc finger domain-containing protein [Cellulomonas dongxiuzhuiae]
MVEDEDLLLAVLNSSPVVDGAVTEELEGAAGRELVARFGGAGTASELASVRRARAALHAVIRGQDDAQEQVAAMLRNASLVPEVTATGVRWELSAPADERLAARAVMAWSRVQQELPGRLRPCANDECNLFLVDHSRPGTAKWCSMAVCGNRMKVRSHAERARRGA